MRIKELFTVPEGQKVTEKVFGKVLISSICSILLCMACLVSTTWAWFSLDITSTNNAIQIGQFAVSVTVENAANESSNAGTYQYQLNAGEYNVIINAGGSTASGHCVVTLADQSYKTIRIGGEDNPSEVSFKVTITENKIEVTDTTEQTNVNTNGSQPITLTITPVWGAPEGNGGLGSTSLQSLETKIDVYVMPENNEQGIAEDDEDDDTQATAGDGNEEQKTDTGKSEQNAEPDTKEISPGDEQNANPDNVNDPTITGGTENERDTTQEEPSSIETDT